jgi:hypothetical protein
MESGLKLLFIPVANCVLSSAWRSKSKRIRKQAWIEFGLGCDLFELNVMTAPQLMTDAILGANCLNEYEVMNFANRSFSTKKGNVATRHSFFFDAMAGGGWEIRSVSHPSNLADFLQLLQTIDQDRSQPGVSVKGTDVRNPEIPESRVDPKQCNSGVCDESSDEEGEVNPLLLEVRREDVSVEDSGPSFPDTLNCSRIYEDPEEGSDALVQHYIEQYNITSV